MSPYIISKGNIFIKISKLVLYRAELSLKCNIQAVGCGVVEKSSSPGHKTVP